MHTHRLPPTVRFAFIGLTLAVFLCLIGIGLMAGAVYQANQYMQGRGEYRDQEAARMEAEWQERFRQGQCDLLDKFPEGGWLDGPRADYGCGPGIPIERLSPEQQAELRGRAVPKLAPSSLVPSGPPAALGDGATANAQGLSPAQPGA